MNLIKTDRLILRLLNEDDNESFVSLCRAEGFDDYSTGRFAGMNPQNAAKFITDERVSFTDSGLARMGVFVQSTEALVGICGLYKMTDTHYAGKIGIAYRFPKVHWGKGYAPEAAKALLDYGMNQLHQEAISAIIDPSNTRSQRVVEKIGMKFVSDVLYKNQPRQQWSLLRSSVTE